METGKRFYANGNMDNLRRQTWDADHSISHRQIVSSQAESRERQGTAPIEIVNFGIGS